jgi:predicted phosphoribosyltransferase
VKRSLNLKKTTAKLLRPKDNLRAHESREPTNPPSTNRCVIEVDSGLATGGRIGKVSMQGNSSNFTNSKEVRKKNMLMPIPPKVHYPEHFLKNHALKK